VLVMVVEATQICVTQARVMRIVQDGNRSYALGRLDAALTCPAGRVVDAPQTAAFIKAAAGRISPRASFESKVNCNSKTVVSTVRLPILDMSGLTALPFAAGTRITVSAQQIKEF
jgi:hypothetical protein